MMAAAQYLHLGRDDLDVAGGQLGIFAVPLTDHAGDLDGGLLVKRFEGLHRILSFAHHLGDAVKVPKNGKTKVSPDLPEILQETGQRNGLAYVGHPQLATGMAAEGGLDLIHVNQLQFV